MGSTNVGADADADVDVDADVTVNRFKRFFGDVKGKRFFFTNGLDKAALKHLETIQVFRTQKKSRR
ncbi:TPA: hypothetical protein ACKP5X_001646 [Stenotrophomonas maltophilia]